MGGRSVGGRGQDEGRRARRDYSASSKAGCKHDNAADPLKQTTPLGDPWKPGDQEVQKWRLALTVGP